MVQDPVFIRKVTESARLLSGAMKMLDFPTPPNTVVATQVQTAVTKTEKLDDVPVDNFSKM